MDKVSNILYKGRNILLKHLALAAFMGELVDSFRQAKQQTQLILLIFLLAKRIFIYGNLFIDTIKPVTFTTHTVQNPLDVLLDVISSWLPVQVIEMILFSPLGHSC